jgi:hypothetical protein
MKHSLHLASVRRLFLLLLALAWLPGAAGAAPALARPAPALRAVLNPDGTLRAGARGSFAAQGYAMSTAANGQPVFRPVATHRTQGAGDERWQDGFTTPGASSNVNAIVRAPNGDLYVGGNFTRIGNAAASYIAKWNGTVWSVLGTGLNGYVQALALDGRGNLYAGGNFTAAGSVAASRIAKWDGTAWSGLGDGLSEAVYALALDGGGNLYAGGRFTTAGGAGANNIAKWNGSAWSPLGDGLNQAVYTLAVDGGGNVYAGGSFTTAGGAAVSNIAKWDGAAWSTLSTGLNGGVNALALDGGGNLYAGGGFTTAGGTAANGIAKWNGTAWSPLGAGLNNGVSALAVDASGNLYAGGLFTTAGGTAASNIAKWNGTTWSPLGTGLNSNVSALAVDASGNVYAGGAFSVSQEPSGNRIELYFFAKWDGTTWGAPGAGPQGTVNALVLDGSGNVYIGGSFTTVGNATANRIAKWDGRTWSVLGTGLNNTVNALALDGRGNLYAGGSFTTAGGLRANRIAKWNGTAWSALGTGTSGNVLALVVDGAGTVYAGGAFVSAGSASASYIAKWNGTAWSALGAGVAGNVLALAVGGSGSVYAGGTFTTAGGNAASRIAKWNGSEWSTLGTGLNGDVQALAVDGTGSVYAGGTFTTAGGTTASRIAKWNGSVWSTLGTGLDGGVNALALDGTGSVYAGGVFTTAGGTTASRIAKWNGSAWSTLGTGLNGPVPALAADGRGNVYAGGSFTAVGDGSKTTMSFGIYQPIRAALVSLSPASGAAGSSLAATGTGLTGATAVTFTSSGGTATAAPAGYTVASDGTGLTGITMPAGLAPGTYTVTVTTPQGISNGLPYTVLAAPTITSFAPMSGPIGTSVTLTGTGFNPVASQNAVFFGATLAPVTAASATSLTVTVPLGTTYQYPTVTNLAANLTAYASQPFVVTLGGAVAFAPKADVGTGSEPILVSIGDVDGDGKPDLATANYSDNTVSVLRNTSTAGTVSFAPGVSFPTGSGPFAVAIGDVDGDGKPDLATANNNSNTVSVLRNTSTAGTVSFASKLDVGAGAYPISLSIGDVDGDGKPDLAVANFFTDNTVSVLRNTSTVGAVSFAARVSFLAGLGLQSVSIGDVDGDGKPDLATANYTDNTVSVLRNTSTAGTVSFATTLDVGTGSGPSSVAIGDVDGDGKPDLTTANYTDNTVSVLRNTSTAGTVSFAPKVDVGTSSNPYSVSIGDVDGDGKPDLAVANRSSNTVSVLRNTSMAGTVSFAAKLDVGTGLAPQLVAIGDVDGDGKPDLAVANRGSNTVSVLRQVSNDTVLPVLLTSFTATAGASGPVRLAWATASEVNSQAFEVERSLDGVAFSKVGQVAAAGTTTTARTYALLDAQLPTGASQLYYRLRQVDQDGTAHYSPVRAVALAAASTGLSLYPNPAQGGAATLLGAAPGTVVTVFDAVGRAVATAPADASGTAALPGGLPAGVYVVRAGQQALRLTVE